MPPPPPAIYGARPSGADRPAEIVSIIPGNIVCASGAVLLLHLEKPFATSTRRFGRDAPTIQPSYSLTFTIDRDGRAVDIRSGTATHAGFYIDTSDLAPSLAASRFATAAPRRRCTIAYAMRLVPVPRASPDLLYEVASAPTPGQAEREIYDRLGTDGGCRRGPGSPRRLDYPAFEAISQAQGTRAWSFLRFDVDDRGHTRDVRVAGSSGNAALDRASVASLRHNRYAPGEATTGCTFHFYRLGNVPVPAPTLPSDAPEDNGELAACTIDPASIPGLLGGAAYPTAFAARRIEGYAIIGFDTAPWGGIGNVRILAAEPDASFGQASMQAIRDAKVDESETGRRGCIRRVQFHMPREKVTR